MVKLLLLSFLFVEICYADNSKTKVLEERLNHLEREFTILKQDNDYVTPYFAKKLRIGGYFNSTIIHRYGEDTKTESGINEVELGLILSSQITDEVSFFSHIEFEQESKTENQHNAERTYAEKEEQTEPELMFLTIDTKTEHQIQFGALITPFGVSNLDHFDYLRWQNEKPLGLRTKSGKFLIFTDHLYGLNFKGNLKTENNINYKYNLYFGSNTMSQTTLTNGARFSTLFRNEKAELGVSYQHGNRDKETKYDSYGIDFFFEINRLGMRSEYMISNIEKVQQAKSSYIEPWYFIVPDKINIYGRVDYIEDTIGIFEGKINNATFQEIYKKNEYSVGFNYLPKPFWRNSIGFTQHKYVGPNKKLNGKTRDYQTLEFGTVLSF